MSLTGPEGTFWPLGDSGREETFDRPEPLFVDLLAGFLRVPFFFGMSSMVN